MKQKQNKKNICISFFYASTMHMDIHCAQKKKDIHCAQKKLSFLYASTTRMDIHHPQTFFDFFSTKKFKKILSTEFFDFLEFHFLPGCWGTCRLLAPSSAHNLRISKKHLSVQ